MADTLTLKDIMSFFDMKASDFMKEWKVMSPKDKEQIKMGLGNKSLNY